MLWFEVRMEGQRWSTWPDFNVKPFNAVWAGYQSASEGPCASQTDMQMSCASSYPSSSGCQEYEEKSWCNADGSYGSGTAGGNIGRRLLDTCVRVPFSIKMDKQMQGDLLVKTMNWQDYQIDRENLYWVSLEGKRGNERTKKIMAPCHGSEIPKFRWATKLPCSQVGGHLGEPSVTTALEALMFPPFVVAWLNSSLSLQHIPAPPWLTDGCKLRVASEVRVEEVCVAHRQLLSQPATKILLQ